jgi:hypothetical protein
LYQFGKIWALDLFKSMAVVQDLTLEFGVPA